MSEESEVVVSVICLAYNHGHFIRDTLEGFVKQKTSFSFEVFVHDDASTDSTTSIIKEYELKYPNIIKPIYQTENQYAKKTGIIKPFIFPLMKGRYVAWCEGDDFWTDENKLQMQVDVLDNHRECVACFSKVAIVNLDGTQTGRFIPEFSRNDFIFDKDAYFKYCMYPSKIRNLPFQISGLMVRKRIYDAYMTNTPYFKYLFNVGDIPLFLYLGLNGNIYYLNMITSNYRTGNVNSWVGQSRSNVKLLKKRMKIESEGLLAFDNYTMQKYHDYVMKAVNRRKFMVYQREHNIRMMRSIEMKEFYDNLSLQRKLTHYIYHYFPHISEYVKGVYNRNK